MSAKKLLGEGEVVLTTLRTHAKVLVGATLVLLAVALGGTFAAAMMPASWQPIGYVLLAAVLAMVLIVWVLAPFFRWRTSTYTITSRRVITRKGILNRSGHTVPLARITDVSYERSLVDRLLGCGTLQLRTAADGQNMTLPDVPDVEKVQLMLTELLFRPEIE